MTRHTCENQGSLFDKNPSQSELKIDDVTTALDELFHLAGKFRSGEEYLKLLRFVRGFRFYSSFNAMLIYTQRPGAKYVATPKRWFTKYGYRIKVSANPITILRPMGPVMFVFDVSDVEPGPKPKTLPSEVTDPFRIRKGSVNDELETTIENAKRDGILVSDHVAGTQLGGSIRPAQPGHYVKAYKKRKPSVELKRVHRRYEMLISTNLSREAKYATLVHELGHLYCGHLGTPNEKWWPDRRGLSHATREFEAESVSHIVCGRLGIDDPADAYLAGYLQNGKDTPPISVDCIFKAAQLIEKMGKGYLPLRNEKGQL